MARKTYTSRDHHHFVAAFAKREKVSLRTAQRLRQQDDPRWQRFVERLKAETPRPPAPPPDTESGIIAPADVCPDTMHLAILHMWDDTHKRWWAALAAGDVLAMVDYDAALRQIQKAWRGAVKSHERHQKFVREHVPAAEISALLGGFFTPLKTALEAMPAECGPMTNPSDHKAGKAGCAEWLASRITPAIERTLEKLADYAAA